MSNFKEKSGLRSSIGRTFFFLFMPFLCALWVLALGGLASYVFYLLELPPPPPENFYEDDYSIPLSYFFAFFTSIFGVVAFIVGAYLSLFAKIGTPIMDTFNLCDTCVFQRIIKQTLYFLSLAMSFFYAGGFVVIIDERLKIFDSFPNIALLFGITWILGSIPAYLYGIFRAIKDGMDIMQQAAKID